MRAVLRRSLGPCLCSQSRELLGELLAGVEVHLVGRLVLECRVQSVSCGFGLHLNGDGDVEDRVVHVHRVSTGETLNIGLAGRGVAVIPAPPWFATRLFLSGDWLAFTLSEIEQSRDANDDGDTDDFVVHLYHLPSGQTTNLRLAGEFVSISPEWLVLEVIEHQQGRHLNGDGDTEDRVVHVHRLSTGETTQLPLTPVIRDNDLALDDNLWGDHLVLRGSTGEVGKDFDLLYLVDLSALMGLPAFLRGDCNDDGRVDISDAVDSLGSLFLGDQDPACEDACDSNDDGAVDVSDAIASLGALFLGDGPIPLPGVSECGIDPSEDSLGCDQHDGCP